MLSDERPHRSIVNDTGEPQRPPEGTATFGLRKAGWIGMQMHSPAQPSSGDIDHKPVTDIVLDGHNT